jgi:signal transduction histidine kinase
MRLSFGRRSRRLRARHCRRHWPDGRAQHVHAELCRRRAAAAAAPADGGAGALVDDLTRLVGAECAKRNITLRREVEADGAPVSMDRSQIEQALLNVAKNGIEAIGSGGTLTLRLSRRDGRRVLEVEDTGPGIQADVRDQLFTPFFSTKEGGQGIGLTLVQEILANHGFGYALDGPSGGPTRFTIAFE